MKQREVRDGDGVQWVCVQALAGVEGATADAAVDHVRNTDGTVPVVCTPSGGAETVRVSLDAGWEQGIADESLLAAISAARGT